MKYLCLVYLDEAHWSACPDQDCFAFASGLAESGRLVAAEPLHPPHTATTVRVRNGRATMYDGPFAETKELLAGFYLVDAKDLNEALTIATRIPPAKYGSIEVRPVRALDVAAYRSFSPEVTPSPGMMPG
ncbi:YciI family protein [Rhodopila sp.]|uniref:YciI family protein n=1 Tax=Rhodopila sp. TaxID=2480087 RepID=UPI002C6D5A14|nr:YciI family protein [Rhodopila sp.]HVZ08176.1 YciI family protein [Rhodopila sp.]